MTSTCELLKKNGSSGPGSSSPADGDLVRSDSASKTVGNSTLDPRHGRSTAQRVLSQASGDLRLETGYTIVVIDDDEGLRTSVKALLESDGMAVEAYESVQQYSMRAPLPRPKCLILDLHLRGENGLAFFEEMAGAGDHLPVIFLTGDADVPTTVKAMKTGASDFLIKPVDPASLIRAVELAIGSPPHAPPSAESHSNRDAKPDHSTDRGVLAPWQERLAKEKLAKCIANRPIIAQIAADCGLSRGYFGQAFKRTTGLTPHRWLSELRIRSAKELLLTGTPLVDVALLCGFSDQSHFNRRFAAMVGSPPKVWLRRHATCAPTPYGEN